MSQISDLRETDLFGNPVRSRKGKRGRPSLEISSEDRDIVEAALVRGWTNDRIAKTVGISLPSLKRHFRAALAKRDVARERLELAAFAKLAREAIEAGNMSAMRQLREVMERDVMNRQRAEFERQQREAEERGIATEGKIGKKAKAQADAEDALQDPGWGDLLSSKTGLH